MESYQSFSSDIRNEIAQILHHAFTNFESILRKELYPAPKEINLRPETDQYRNLLKMYVFLVSWLISEQARLKEPVDAAKNKKRKDLGVEGKILQNCAHCLEKFEEILHETDSLNALWRGS